MTGPLTFTVPGVAVPAGSKRPVIAGNGRLRSVDSSGARGRDWRAAVSLAASRAMGDRPLLAGPLQLRLTFWVARPASHYRTGRHAGQLKPGAPQYPTTRPDVLKLARAVEDAMTGVVYLDDSQGVTLCAGKRYARILEPSRVEIVVQPLGEEWGS